jgi:hypothetical protein
MSETRVNTDLQELLNRPRETLDIEIKGWLNLNEPNQRADLAKAIIAVGNHGGGFVVIGLDEDDAGQFSPGVNRPPDLSSISQDDIQNAIQKYLEPPIQCRVEHVNHPGSHGLFPIVVVPGGHRTPIKAKAGSPDGKLIAHRIYVRRPGPKSEEPQNASEWDALFERCIRARRDELLDGIRDLLAGSAPKAKPVPPTRRDNLRSFIKVAIERWENKVSNTPEDSTVRLKSGYYDASFAIDGEIQRLELPQLAQTIQRSIRNHSGWPPFAYLSNEPFRPRPVDGAVEAWFGPDKNMRFDGPAYSDFWRISPEGLFFIRRGYNEDGGLNKVAPGTTFDINTATNRIAETIMEVYYIASNMGTSDGSLLAEFKWTGLSGRRLVSFGNPSRLWFDDQRKIEQDKFEISKEIDIARIPDSLPEITWEILHPLYQMFDFWTLPKRLVEEETRALLRNTFAI